MESSPTRMCSHRAVVTATWRNTGRAFTVISAKEQQSGHEIRCDVYVDRIERIQIHTTTKRVYLEDSPETLTVFAFDAEGEREGGREEGGAGGQG